MKRRLTQKTRNNNARKKKKKLNRYNENNLIATPVKKKTGHEKTKVIGLTFLVLLFIFFNLQEPSSLAANNKNRKIAQTTSYCLPTSYSFDVDALNKKCTAYDKVVFKKIISIKKNEIKPTALEKQINSIVKNAPMKEMTKDIAKRERTVAALLVGIAMKESKFGIYSPKKDGNDCFNYWGYRGKENTTLSGYSCFSTPKEAVKIVGDRIESLVKSGLKKPADMIVWKCGHTCAGHSEESVRKWISDVAINYYQINPKTQIAKD
jgi:uncharacterized Rmd1/YagE family protein